MQRPVEDALIAALERGTTFDYASVKALTNPDEPAVPSVSIGAPDFAHYDALLAAGGAS
jgi:hypothetical protein